MSRLFSSSLRYLVRQSKLSALGLAVLVLSLGASAANLPDWMQEAARAPLASYPPETKGVILLDDEATTIRENGETFTVHRWAAKILRKEGKEELGDFGVYFSNDTKITWMKAWSVDPKGTVYELKEKDAIETAYGSGEAYSDIRHKIVTFPAAGPGTIVGLEYQQKHRPYVYEDDWLPQDNVEYPVRKARFSLSLPSGWEHDTYWKNHPKVEPSAVGNSYVWEVSDLPAFERQRQMPSSRAILPRMVVTYRPASEAAKGKAYNSWAGVSSWYFNLADPQRTTTPEIQAKTAALTAGAKTPLEKIRAVAAFAQRDIRYVAIEIGIGGARPHPAREIFANRYGDCKDKATLMSTMLREVGIESDYLLVDTRRGVVNPDIPSERSNHVVLAIHVPVGDAEIASLPAVYTHEKLGNLLIFDPTDEFTPVGYLPYYLQASYGVVIRATDGGVIKLPLHDPKFNKLNRTAKMSLDGQGTLRGSVEEIRTGAEAKSARSRMLEAKGTDRASILESFLGQFLGNFQLTKASVVNLEAYDQPIIFRYEFVAPNYAKVAGNLLLVPPRVLGSKMSDLLEDGKKRIFPVEFHTASAQVDDFQISLPPGYEVDELPDPMKVSYGFGNYKSDVAFENGVIHYRREFQVTSVLVPMENIQDLQKFYRQIGRDERSTAVLKHK